MSFDNGPGQEDRRNLDELDPILRARLRRLDEPTERSDWSEVVSRSRPRRLSAPRTVALAALAVAVVSVTASLAVTTWVTQTTGHGHGPGMMQLAFNQGHGQAVILYSTSTRTQFLDNADGRRPRSESSATGRSTAAIVRSLSKGGPFIVDAALLRASTTSQKAAVGPRAGDQALFSLNLYRTVGRKRSAGSAQLSCQYGLSQEAYCDATVNLPDGSRLTASGTLDGNATHLNLIVTSASGSTAIKRGALLATPNPTT